MTNPVPATTIPAPGSDIQGREESRVYRESDERCPKCGLPLKVNDYGQKWCWFGRDTTACNYGISHDDDCASIDYENMPYMPHKCDCGYEEARRDKR